MTTPVRVLLVALKAPAPELIDQVRSSLAEQPAELILAHLRPLGGGEETMAARVHSLHHLAPEAGRHGPAFRRSLQGAPPPERLHLHLTQDPYVAGLLDQPTVLVGLDPAGLKAARKLAKNHDSVEVADGDHLADAVRRAAERRSTETDRLSPGSDRAPGNFARMRLHAPGLSDERRAALATEIALAEVRHGHLAEAERVAVSAARKIRDPRTRADLLGDVTSLALHLGHQTDLATESVAAELTVADEALESSPTDAATCFAEAARTAFHPVLHLHHTRSPLAADPAGFLAAFEASATAQRLRGRAPLPRDSAPSHPSAQGADTSREGEGSTRVLLLTRGNANFLGELQEHLSDHEGFEVRLVDTAGAAPELNRYARDVGLLAERILEDPVALGGEVRSSLGDDIAWADVVLVEWCTVLAALVSRAVPPDKRLVVRLHSYEAFTVWPHLVDFTAVDDLLLVSDHLRELALAAVPALRGPDAPELSVLPLAMHLRQFARPKPDEARHTLAMIGWHKVVKDPLWALEIIRTLRAHDNRYRLLLVGDEFDGSVSAATRSYGQRLAVALEGLEAEGAVRRLGRTDDVPGTLQDVGIILSTSVRESFHAGLVEGAASGAVPVVRDWPYFAGRAHSARTLFPDDWVVGTPEEAAERILALTRDGEAWRSAGAEAADHVISTWDWDVVQSGYDEFLRR